MLKGFSDKQIVSLLDSHSLWGRRAAKEIVGRKEDFVPYLLESLDHALANPEEVVYGDYERFVPSAYLLAQMRESSAYPRIVGLASYDQDTTESFWGDMLINDYSQILRDTFDGDASLLSGLMENFAASPWNRVMALDAWGMLCHDGHISRERTVDYLRRLVHEIYAGKNDKDSLVVLTSVASVSQEHRLEELIPDVAVLYEKNLVEIDFMGDYDAFLKGFEEPPSISTERIDALQKLEFWGWFKEAEDDDDDDDDDDFEEDDDFDEEGPDREEPPRALHTEKTGRNDPCPCGSGKKYKKCCMN